MDGSKPEWTIDTYAAHNEAFRIAEEKFQAERDRRYAEVNIEKEKAVQIKEAADLAALQLARDIQSYKDEKANELRSQIEGERLSYANKNDLTAATDKIDATLKPVLAYIAAQQGGIKGTDKTLMYVVIAANIIIGVIMFLVMYFKST